MCCIHGLSMQSGCSWSFRVSQSTVSAGIPATTTGNMKHSCYSRYNLFSHFATWAGKKVKTLWLFPGMPGNCQCVFMDQYPNMDREINVCRTPLSCQVCRQPGWFCVPKISVQGPPGLESVDKPWAPQPRHITSLHTGTFFSWKPEIQLLQVFHFCFGGAVCTDI